MSSSARTFKKALASSGSFSSQVLDDSPRSFRADENLAKFTAIADTLEQRQPLVRRRLPIARDPLDPAQPVNVQQHIQVRDFPFAIQVIERIIEFIADRNQVWQDEALKHGR
jgi:hypothetical protein